MPTYILDSDVFINSHQCQYGMDFCPAFWDWLIVKNTEGVVFSIENVCDELGKQNDALSMWANGLGEEFFLPLDQSATDSIQTVTGWVNEQSRFNRNAIAEFFSKADMYLVAYSLAHDFTLVTQEASAPNSKK